MTSVIIVTYNSEKHIYKCLDSLKQHTSSDTEVVIVDNSGKNYGLDFVNVNQRGSYPSGLNQGIAVSKGETIVCCNPDIRFSRNWLNIMLETRKNYDVVGPMTNFASGLQGMMQPVSQLLAIEVRFLIGFCFLLRRDLYNRVGPFGEEFEFEQDDIDYSYRVRKAGFRLGIAPCFVEHIGHQSVDAGAINKRYLSLYRILEKYKDENIVQYMGTTWNQEWLAEVAHRYPDVKGFKSYATARI